MYGTYNRNGLVRQWFVLPLTRPIFCLIFSNRVRLNRLQETDGGKSKASFDKESRAELEDDVSPTKASDIPDLAPRFKAGDVARRRVGGQVVVIRGMVPIAPEVHRAQAEGTPPPPFEYACYWFEGTEYKTAIVFEFELA